jgi:small basic protein
MSNRSVSIIGTAIGSIIILSVGSHLDTILNTNESFQQMSNPTKFITKTIVGMTLGACFSYAGNHIGVRLNLC